MAHWREHEHREQTTSSTRRAPCGSKASEQAEREDHFDGYTRADPSLCDLREDRRELSLEIDAYAEAHGITRSRAAGQYLGG
jgi:hypothetical protein